MRYCLVRYLIVFIGSFILLKHSHTLIFELSQSTEDRLGLGANLSACGNLCLELCEAEIHPLGCSYLTKF